MKASDELVVLGGPRFQFVTPPPKKGDPYCVMKAIFPPGFTVPLHSHLDRETFYIVSGEIQGLKSRTWQTLRSGDVFDVPGGLKHAWRNVGTETVSLVVTTTGAMGCFFCRIGRPAAMARPGPPSWEEMQHFVQTSLEVGHWLGGPDDNAAVGISLPPLV